MEYTAIYDLRSPGSTASELKKKVTVAVSKAAFDVINEAASTPGHDSRYRWAKQALQNAEGFAEMMMWAVLGNTTVQTNGNDTADSDIQWVVNGLVDIFAI